MIYVKTSYLGSVGKKFGSGSCKYYADPQQCLIGTYTVNTVSKSKLCLIRYRVLLQIMFKKNYRYQCKRLFLGGLKKLGDWVPNFTTMIYHWFIVERKQRIGIFNQCCGVGRFFVIKLSKSILWLNKMLFPLICKLVPIQPEQPKICWREPAKREMASHVWATFSYFFGFLRYA